MNITATDSPVAARKNRRVSARMTTMATEAMDLPFRSHRLRPTSASTHDSRPHHYFRYHRYSFSENCMIWNKKNRRVIYIAMLVVVLIFSLLLLLLKNPDNNYNDIGYYDTTKATTVTHNRHSTSNDPQRQNKNNHPAAPLVCSHQLLNPPPLDIPTRSKREANTPPNGSLDAMTALWHNGAGVTCFDIDAVVLSDGNMVASHPRRLNAAIIESAARLELEKRTNSVDADKKENNKDGAANAMHIPLEEHTLDSIRDLLGLRKNKNDNNKDNNNLRSTSGSSNNGIGSTRTADDGDGTAACPFPLFDEEVLPHFAKLVHGIPGAFSSASTKTGTTIQIQSSSSSSSSSSSASSHSPKWALRGPLLNIDLKPGPYLTESRVLKLAEQINVLGLEEYVAICVTAPPPTATTENETDRDKIKTDKDSPSSSLDLLEVMHRYNTEGRKNSSNDKRNSKGNGNGNGKPIIPLGLVLRDLVPEDADVDRIRRVVEEFYPESIKALVPSSNFPKEWYHKIRYNVHGKDDGEDGGNSRNKNNNEGDHPEHTVQNDLWMLPMTVWTIDSKEDYRKVSSIKTAVAMTTNGSGGGDDDDDDDGDNRVASAVVANKPTELLIG